LVTKSEKVSVSADLEGTGQLLHLYRSLWKARARRSRIAGRVYLVLSAFFLILSYFTRYLLFEVIAIISLLLGVALTFVSLEKYVKLSVLNESSASLLSSLSDLIENSKVHGKAVYIPTSSKTLVFIPKDEYQDNEVDYSEIKGIKLDERGVVMSSPGMFLKRLYERELGCNAENFDLPYLIEWIPRILVDNLKIAEKMEIAKRNDAIQVKLIGPIFSRLCEEKRIGLACKTIGCPVCSSIGDILAQSARRVVFYKGCEYAPDKSQLIWHYTLGSYVRSIGTKD
jgi:hypothetical protein